MKGSRRSPLPGRGFLPRLHLVTDDDVVGRPDFSLLAAELIHQLGPAVALHLRAHGLPGRVLYERAQELRAAASEAGALLLVNDRVDVALAAASDGAQLGRRSIPVAAARALLGPSALVGYSAHARGEPEGTGADFLLFGPVFPSPTHPRQRGAGPAALQGVVNGCNVPVIAIGGVSAERVADVLAARAHGVAVLSGVWRAADPAAAAAALLAALEGGFV